MASTPATATFNYRGRLAPSPTGYLHVGHARTFWAAFQRAREADGTLVMRMEDRDPDRCRPVYADAALDELRWLGIHGKSRKKGDHFAPYVLKQAPRRGSISTPGASCCCQSRACFHAVVRRKDLATALAPRRAERAQTASRIWKLDSDDDELDTTAPTGNRFTPALAVFFMGGTPQLPGPAANEFRRPGWLKTGASAFPMARS